jgi:hypothetical protein
VQKQSQSKRDLAAFFMLWGYIALQVMDFCTTIFGTSLGIKERNELLLEIAIVIGDLPALMLAKALCIFPAVLAFRRQKTWMLLSVFLILNVYYLDIVSGNVIAIYGVMKT